jgi:hypothetical protein
MKLSQGTVLFTLASLVSAKQDYFIINPVAGTVWNVSSPTCEVKWMYTNNNNETEPKKNILVTLMKGPALGAVNFATPDNQIDPEAGSVSFPCPDAPDGSDYFIKLGSVDYNDFRYSHYFSIVGGKKQSVSSVAYTFVHLKSVRFTVNN